MASNSNNKLVARMDLSREPMPKIRETNSSEEEEEAIGAHLMYMDKILGAIKDRESKLSGDTKKKVSEFRSNWKKYFEADSDLVKSGVVLGVSQSNDVEGRGHQLGSGANGQTETADRKCNIGGSKGDTVKLESSFNKSKSSRGKKKKRRGRRKQSSSSESSRADSQSSSHESGESTDDMVIGDSHSSSSDMISSQYRLRQGRGRDVSFVEVMRQFDNRTVPRQERYDEHSGQDLASYLEKFESYCRCNFKGSKTLWIGELELALSGKTLEAFKAHRAVDDSYKSIKRKLLEWYHNSRDVRKGKNRRKFKNAGYNVGDSLYLFAVKLEALFKLAYPRHKVGHSETLREKYLSAVPRSFRKELKVQMTSHTLKGKKVSWEMIKKCANLKDLEGENDTDQELGKGEDVDREIVINVGRAGGNNISSVMNSQSRPVYSGQFRNSNSRYSQRKSNNQWDQVNERSSRATNRGRNYDRIAGELVTNRPMGGNSPDGTTRFSLRNLGNFGGKCNFCGRIGHIEQSCRSKLRRCFICGQDGHFFRNCALRGSRRPRSQSVQPSQGPPLGNRQLRRDRRVSHDGYQRSGPLN